MPKPLAPGGAEKAGKPGTIFGTDGNDFLIIGTSGDDTINAMAGDDIIEGSLGNDSIDGGDGDQDFLIYTFPVDDIDLDGSMDYSVSRIEKGNKYSYEISYQVDGITYTDTVKNVEYIIFGDGSVLDTVNNILDPGDPPPPDPDPGPANVTFDAMTPIQFASVFGVYHDAYQSPEGYIILQMSTGGFDGYDEVGPLADYDGTDPDFEFRVYTDADGTTHEMALLGTALGDTYTVSSVTLTGLDAGEVIEVFATDGNTSTSVILSVDDGDISDGVLDLTTLAGFDGTDVLQFSLVAISADSEFYVDDIILA